MITLLLLVCTTYMYGVVLHAHPVRGESHNQRNTTREVATKPYYPYPKTIRKCIVMHSIHFCAVSILPHEAKQPYEAI